MVDQPATSSGRRVPGPMYCADGRTSLASRFCSRMCADQPAVRAQDPRARVLRRACQELKAPRYEVAVALERAALAELKERYPDRVLATNVEFWSAVVLDYAEVPPDLFTPMFTCARVAGWSAHILEQKREARLIRPTAKYVGAAPREVSDI